MLKVRLKEPLSLFCCLRVSEDTMQKLNCATTGGNSGHAIVRGNNRTQFITQLRQALQNATVDDFNFRHLTDPDNWNKYAKGEQRTANGAFFTLLYRYNQLAEREGKPTIDDDDIVDFIKKVASDNRYIKSVDVLSTIPGHKTGNDGVTVIVLKAPISLLLNGKDLGILGENTAERLRRFGAETDIYIKLAIDSTYSRDDQGELTVLEEGIQPLSFHRDADSKNTRPSSPPDPKDEAWDDDYGISKSLSSRAPGEYFAKQAAKRKEKQGKK